MSNQVVAILLRTAAAYLDEYGWRQKSNGVHLRDRCALGAISSAGHLLNVRLDDLDKAIIALYEEVNSSLAAWNDKPERTEQEVIDLFNKVADKLETQEC